MRLKKTNYFLMSIVFLLSFLIAGCSGGQESSTTGGQGNSNKGVISEENQTQGITDDTITVGAWGALTGSAAAYRVVNLAADALFKYVNEQGGIHGRKIEYKLYDDQYQPSKTVGIAKRLVEEDKIFAVVSPLGTGTTQAVLPYMQEHGVPIVSVSSSTTIFTDPPIPNVWVTQLNAKTEGELNAWYVAKKLGAKRPAIFYQNDEMGKATLEYNQKVFKRFGIEPTALVSGEMTSTDYTAYALKLKEANPDVVMINTLPDPARKIIEAANQVGFNPQWFVNLNANDPSMSKLLGELWNGVHTVNWVKPIDGDDPEIKLFKEQFKKYYPNEEAGVFALQGWTMTKTFIKAIEDAGPDLTRDKLVEAIENIQGWDNGVSGPVTFGPDDNSGVTSAYFVKIEDGVAVNTTDFMDLVDIYEEEGWED